MRGAHLQVCTSRNMRMYKFSRDLRICELLATRVLQLDAVVHSQLMAPFWGAVRACRFNAFHALGGL
jgi:hypothetical protein